MALHKVTGGSHSLLDLQPTVAALVAGESVPRDRMPKRPISPDAAYRIISDELALDGNVRLNLATFVTTWMPEHAQRLIDETLDKNMIDKDEYPQTAELERRCVEMLARLWNAPKGLPAIGTSTTGSSEAAMLGGLALKWRWKARRVAENKPTDKPNLVMGANVQVCWDKFCRYFDVEPRLVPLDDEHLFLTPERAAGACDENTIGVVAILGSTFDGSYEDVAGISAALDALEREKGWHVPIHVDAASGGFVAPFIDRDIEWDFRVERVRSINASGHKYGLVYPGVGWALWRTRDDLPEELVYNVNYLGGEMPTFALNFSRPGAQVIAQYFMFISLGHDGYKQVQEHTRAVARHLAAGLQEIHAFELVSDGNHLPVVAATVRSDAGFDVFDISRALRVHGWLVPAYTMPANREDLAVLRFVCRADLNRDLVDILLGQIREAVFRQTEQPAPAKADTAQRPMFHH